MPYRKKLTPIADPHTTAPLFENLASTLSSADGDDIVWYIVFSMKLLSYNFAVHSVIVMAYTITSLNLHLVILLLIRWADITPDQIFYKSLSIMFC